MDQTNELFLTILRAALRGEGFIPAEPITGQQWQALLQLAAIHKVDPLIFEAAFPHIRSSAPELAAALKPKIRRQVILQTMRTGEFLALNRALREAGIRPIVVKGITCRSLYPSPDHRPSSDEDVLVPPGLFDECLAVLEQFGMSTETAAEDFPVAYEVPFRKADSPLYIELHKTLFPLASEAYGDLNRFFADVFDRSIEVLVQGEPVRTMEPTDHLFYLICHAYKHFLHSGFGIRQVCDMVLFAQAHGDQIDWERILRDCKSIRAHKFAAALFAIGRNHLGFDADAACYPDTWRKIPVDESAMLEDILRAGIYGSAEGSRQHSSTITLDAVAAQKEGRQTRGLRASLFPPAKALEHRYPWLKKHPYLLPAAWCGRICHYAKETAARDGRAADALKVGAERLELLRQYDILN